MKKKPVKKVRKIVSKLPKKEKEYQEELGRS